MLNLKPVTYKPLSSSSVFTAEMTDSSDDICIISDGINKLEVQCSTVNEQLKMEIKKNDFLQNDDALMVAVEYLLGHHREILKVEIKKFSGDATANLLKKYFSTNAGICFERSAFYQLRGLLHMNRDFVPAIESWAKSSDDRLYPVRPDIQSGTMYSRYVPSLGKILSFRIIDKEKDLDIFHEWHNQSRVANFWELAQPKEELLQYIEKGLNDKHTLPMIAECDGVAIGYFEMYWTREDRLAPYYSSEAFDRGFHFLIGNVEFLGFQNTDAVLKALTHFLFIDEIRTRKIMAEPRSDNAKVLRYVDTFAAWKKLYEFDFPHKRAALLECQREAFFMGNYL